MLQIKREEGEGGGPKSAKKVSRTISNGSNYTGRNQNYLK